MKYLFLSFLIILPLIFSCHKPEDNPTPKDKVPYGDGSRTKIEGRVLEYGSLKPIPNALVVLEEEFHMPFTGGGKYYPIDSTYTNADGYYIYDFKHIDKLDDYYFSYQVKALAPKYFDNNSRMENGYAHRSDIILDPYAWIKVHVKNVNPFDEKDYLFTNIWGGGGKYYGLDIDITEVYPVPGARKIKFFSRSTKNKITVEKLDSLYLPPHDTINYEILY